MTITEFRSLLRRLDPTELAALLHELGFELYHREIARWRVLSDLADELMDRATYDARVTLARNLTPARRSVTRARKTTKRRSA
jgi:hypothetical protein